MNYILEFARVMQFFQFYFIFKYLYKNIGLKNKFRVSQRTIFLKMCTFNLQSTLQWSTGRSMKLKSIRLCPILNYKSRGCEQRVSFIENRMDRSRNRKLEQRAEIQAAHRHQKISVARSGETLEGASSLHIILSLYRSTWRAIDSPICPVKRSCE